RHKIGPDVMECFSPFTVVNGVIWPRVEVEPTTYRFRVLNASNARTYRLVLTRGGRPNNERITQIGTDGGLLAAPVHLPAQGLVLASAERADILVDFSDLDVGTELTLFNNAAAPFDGAFADPSTAGTANLDGLLPYPEVLRFHVIDGHRGSRRPPAVLATDFQRPVPEDLAGCMVRAIALVESFQVLSRRPAAVETPEGGITDSDTRATVRIGQEVQDGIPHALDANELGLKDTVRVNANEVVDILVRFDTFAGRYMYHCHI